MKVTPFYKDIMRVLRHQGQTHRQIKEYLLEEYGFSVSRRTILYHTNDEWRANELQACKDKRNALENKQ